MVFEDVVVYNFFNKQGIDMYYKKASEGAAEYSGFIEHRNLLIYFEMQDQALRINRSIFKGDVYECIYEKHKSKTIDSLLRNIVGGCSIVIIDKDEISLYVDSKGLESLYYHVARNNIIISNSLIELKKHIKLLVNTKMLLSFFTFINDFTHETLCQDVYKVLPTDSVCINSDSFSVIFCKNRLLNFSNRKSAQKKIKEYIFEIESHLESQLLQNINGFEGEVYNLFSGGVDSSIIQVLLAKNNHRDCITFTLAGDALSEAYTKDPVKNLKLNQNIVECNVRDYIENLIQGIKVSETPFMFSDFIMTNRVFNLKPNCVFFYGNGADAVFGHTRFLFASNFVENNRYLVPLLKIAFSIGIIHKKHKSLFDASLKKELTEHDLSNITYRNHIDTVQKAFGAKDFNALFSEIVKFSNNENYSLSDRILLYHSFAGECYWMNRLVYSLATSTNNYVAFPFWELGFTDVMMHIPVSTKMKNGTSKFLAKKLLAEHLPKKLIYRKKLGLASLNNAFKEKYYNSETVKQLIKEISARNYPYFSFNYNEIFYNHEYSGIADNLIKFHLWHKEFID